MRYKSCVCILLTLIFAIPCHAEPVKAWWFNTDNTDVDVLTVRSFQGIVNRAGPKLFIVQWENDLRWVEIFRQRYGEFIQLNEIRTEQELFSHPELREYCSRMVAYDKTDSQLAMNGALTMAGILGACVVDAADMPTLRKYGFVLADDKRNYAAWQTNEGVNAWALSMQPLTNQDYYCVSEGLIHGNPKSVDTAVNMGMLWFLLDSRGLHQDDRDIQEQILAKYPPHTIATGWWTSEVHDVRMISAHGHTFATNSANCSFFQYGKNFINIGKQNAPTDPLPEIEPDKVYAFISYTQGDAVYFCSDRNMNQWTAPSEDGSGRLVREKYPFGLMHNSIQTILQPMVPAYLYDTQDPPNQWFTGKAYGYAYPSTLLENGYLAEHLDKGGAAMQEMDITDLMLNDRAAFFGTSDTSLIDHIVHIMDPKPRSLILKHPFSDKPEEKDSPRIFNGIPAFGDPVMERTFKDKSMDIPATMDAIHESMQKRRFFWIFLKNQAKAWELEKLFEGMRSDPRFSNLVLMNPDAFIRLYATQVDPGFSWRVTDDAWISENDFDLENGDDPVLRVGGEDQSRAFIKFVVDTWDPDINGITLRLKVHGNAGDVLQIQSFNDTWQEEEPAQLRTLGSKKPVASTILVGGQEIIEIDMNKAINGPGTYSFMLTVKNNPETIRISSRESSSPPWLAAQ